MTISITNILTPNLGSAWDYSDNQNKRDCSSSFFINNDIYGSYNSDKSYIKLFISTQSDFSTSHFIKIKTSDTSVTLYTMPTMQMIQFSYVLDLQDKLSFIKEIGWLSESPKRIYAKQSLHLISDSSEVNGPVGSFSFFQMFPTPWTDDIKSGVISKYKERLTEFDKSTDHIPFSIVKKKAQIRGSGISYKVTR